MADHGGSASPPTETARLILDALGEQQARALHAKGAGMDIDQLCGYALYENRRLPQVSDDSSALAPE